MATAIYYPQVLSEYNENLLNVNSMFNDDLIWNVTSGSALITQDDSRYFKSLKSLKIETLDSGVTTEFNTTSNLGFVAPFTGRYILSYRIFFDSSLGDDPFFTFNFFKNGLYFQDIGSLFTEPDSATNEGKDGKWSCWSQAILFNEGDIVTFNFTYSAGGFLDTIWLDGLKIEFDRGLGEPTEYRLPKDYCCSVDAISTITGYASYSDSGYTELSPFSITGGVDTILPNRATTRVTSQRPDDVDEFYFAGGVSGTLTDDFELNETITGGTSGATATVRRIDTDTLYFVNLVGSFTAGETVTGSTSGATLTTITKLDPVITGRNGDGLDVMIYFKAKSTAIDQWLDIWIDIGGSIGELYRQTFSFPKGTGTERGILYALPSAYTLNTFEANGGKVKVRSNNNVEVYLFNFNFDRSHKAR